jgi:outer membrane lipoprotein SlyB
VTVDNEGSVKEKSGQTQRTAVRSGIGAAIGAIIGGVSGGGKGAAIGAVVGAGAGAGSVILQGRDDLELESGTELTIRTTSPRQISSNSLVR